MCVLQIFGEHNSNFTMVYDTHITIVFMGFINPFITGGPHNVGTWGKIQMQKESMVISTSKVEIYRWSGFVHGSDVLLSQWKIHQYWGIEKGNEYIYINIYINVM